MQQRFSAAANDSKRKSAMQRAAFSQLYLVEDDGRELSSVLLTASERVRRSCKRRLLDVRARSAAFTELLEHLHSCRS